MQTQEWQNPRRGNDQDNIFQEFYSYSTVVSTNVTARELLGNKGVPDCFVVFSETQTQGRGRWGREWWSPEGGLWCSLVVPKTSIPSLKAALSIVQTITALTPLRAGIRWPNDIIVRNKKVAGVLTESEKEKTIVGIGINVNQPDFPPELEGATSLAIETGKTLCTEDFLHQLVKQFEKNLNNPGIIDQIREVIVMLGQKITVKVRDTVKTGELWDIGTDGALLLRESSGVISELAPSEVEFVR
jgi:BirA family biotin operon repressor/biotin-[acetyl-CoA-carboxylase] ligase